jgi:PAS domain S-box-containing protein
MLKRSFPKNSALPELPHIEYSQIVENKEMLQTLLDYVPHGILIARAPDGATILQNRAGQEIRHTPTKEISLKDYGKVWHLLRTDKTRVPLEELPIFRALRGEIVEEQEYIVEFADGGLEYRLIRAVPLFKPNGDIFAAMVIFSDITQQKKAEQALSQSEERYRELFENAHDIIYTHDLVGNFTSFNKAATKLLGYEQNEKPALHINDVVAPESINETRAMLDRLYLGEQPPSQQLEVFTKDRRKISLEVNARMIVKDGQPVGVQGIARNITDRKRQEDEVRHLKDRFLKAFNASPFPMGIIQISDKKYIDINDTALRQNGFTRQEMLGKTVDELGLPVHKEQINKFWELFAEKGQVQDFELELKTKFGERRVSLFSAERIDVEGEVCALISKIDITEQRRSERIKAATYQISEAANAAENLQELFEKIHKIVSELMYANNFYIALRDEKAGLLRIPYFVDEFDQNPKERKLRRGLTEYVLRTQQPLQALPAVIQNLEATGEVEAIGTLPVDWFGVPLKTKSETIGALVVQSYTEGITYGEEEKDILIFVSTQVARAIERKRAEEALRESQRWFSTVFNLSPNPMGINRLKDGRYVDVNNSLLNFSGYTYEEMIGKTPDELNTWASASYKEMFLQKLYNREKIQNIETKYHTRHGKECVALVSAEIIEINGEEFLLTSLSDITERKHTEETLRASEERFSKAFNLSPLPMHIVSFEDTKYIYVNDSFLKATGYTREEMIGKTGDELNLWVSQKERKKVFDAFIKNRQVNNFEIRYRRKDGEIRTGLGSSETISLDGKLCALSVINDITDRKRAEEALMASEERFSKSFNLSPLPMSLISLQDNGIILDVNDAFFKATGYSREESIGKSSTELNLWVSDKDRELGLQLALSQQRISNLEGRYRRKDGSIRTILFSAETINIDNNPCLLSVLNDITERKQTEEILRASEERFSKAFNLSPLPMHIVSLKTGTYIAVNDSFLKATGFVREEILGKTGSEFNLWVSDEDRQKVAQTLRETGKLDNVELGYRRRNGEIRMTLVSCEIMNMDGEECVLTVISDITDRKQREEALKASEERFSTAFYLSPNPMCISTMDTGLFIDVNDAFAAALGGTREELIGRTSKEINFFADYSQREAAINIVRDKEKYQTDDIEIFFRRLDGEVRIGWLSGEIIDIEGKKCLLTVINDITERKKQEEELLSARREWQATFDALSDAVILIDKDDHLVRANKAFFERNAFSNDEAFHYTVREFSHLDNQFISADECPLCELRARQTGGTIELPAGVISAFPILASVDPIFDSNGEYVGCVQVTRNLSALYSAREEAEQERISLRATIEQMAEGLMIFDETGAIIRANSSAQNIFGFSLEQMIRAQGNLLADGRFSDKDGQILAPHEHPVRTALREQRSIRGLTVWYASPHSQTILLSITASPFFNERGKLTGAVSIVRDITQQQRELERLQQADKLRALGQLASGVAHNFNNALAAVIGYSQLALRKTDDVEVQKHLHVIEKSSKDAARMVERIQNFSRTRSKQDEFVPARIFDIVKDAVDITRPRWRYDAEAQGLKYSVSFDWQTNEELFITCDPSELREVFVNIILNALDAMPTGGSLTIGATTNEESITISFKDTGIGMTEEVKTRVFDPFFTTKGTLGLGLGLSESYRIVERHLGHLDVESRIDFGTTFLVTLPATLYKNFRAKRDTSHLPLVKKRFLVIDDEELVRYALLALLEELGHEVFQAAAAQEALELLNAHQFDLVFTDLAMPDLDGIALAQKIRDLQPNTKIVLMSGYSLDAVLARVQGTNCIDAPMSKPFRLDEVQSVIKDLMGVN